MKLHSIIFIFFLAFPAVAHEGHKHSNAPNPDVVKMENAKKLYLETIKPIFQKKCYDCHSNQTQFPWYYKIPGVKQYIDHDLKSAKKHIDMSKDFPFKGHGTIAEDLKSILNEMTEKEMPPLSYRLMHKGTGVTDEDVRAVKDWIEKSNF